MIELQRYAREHADGFASAELCQAPTSLPPMGVMIKFKRFDVSRGHELDPEISVVTFQDLEARLAENEKEQAVIRELLALKPKE